MDILNILLGALAGATAASVYWLARFKDLKIEFDVALADAQPKAKAKKVTKTK